MSDDLPDWAESQTRSYPVDTRISGVERARTTAEDSVHSRKVIKSQKTRDGVEITERHLRDDDQRDIAAEVARLTIGANWYVEEYHVDRERRRESGELYSNRERAIVEFEVGPYSDTELVIDGVQVYTRPAERAPRGESDVGKQVSLWETGCFGGDVDEDDGG